MKVVLREPQEDALRAEMSAWDGYVSSALLGVEAVRACSRHHREYVEDAREWLHHMALVPIDADVLDDATSLEPARLRSLDAIHLATALSVRDKVGAFFTYDERLAEAAERHDLPLAGHREQLRRGAARIRSGQLGLTTPEELHDLRNART